MAGKLLKQEEQAAAGHAAGAPLQPMNREFQTGLTASILVLLTVAAVVFAGYNYKVESQFSIPDDGVWWLERNGQLVADKLYASGPGASAGIRSGDIVVNEFRGGPETLLRWLETQLGLAGPSIPPSSRVTEYAEASPNPDI